MIKNYLLLILPISLAISSLSFSQEPKIFTCNDFDLNGKVKSCLVITDYGKEEFDFNEKGWLTKSVTRYNENDYDITYYKYENGELSERRDENYREGEFDRNTSIAHFYNVDTTSGKKINERIISYNKELLEQYEYRYDTLGRLRKILRSNSDGLDETIIKYTSYKDENTVSYFLNGVILKSVRTSLKKQKDGSEQKIVLTKDFLEGNPNKATEEVFGADGKLVSEQKFRYDKKEKSFVPTIKTSYEYDERGMLSVLKTKTGEVEEKKEYIYQYDSEEGGNWIKKIITPDNAYTTRKIKYYPAEIVEEEKE